MKALLAAVVAFAVAILAASGAQAGSEASGSAGADADPKPITVLLFHPDDGVDPLGVPFQGSDPFAVRYGPLVADKGRFDFPFFVADGVLPIESLPDPAQPYVSALEAYTAAVDLRAAEQSPVSLTLASRLAGRQAVVSVSAAATAALADEDLRLWLALAEDHVQYQPPPGLTNGVTDHRFTVRAVADLGPVDLASAGATTGSSHSFLIDDTWQRDRLSVAAWVQQGAPSPRFDAREVVQATHAALGESVVQAAKGVLVEMLSATWCDPCLYGDEAVEALAVARGVAEPGDATPRSRYLRWQPSDVAPVAVAAALGALVVAVARRRAP